jgi:hypothetical protein
VLILNGLVHSDKPVIEIGRDEMKNAANKPPHEKEPTLLPGKYTSKSNMTSQELFLQSSRVSVHTRRTDSSCGRVSGASGKRLMTNADTWD